MFNIGTSEILIILVLALLLLGPGKIPEVAKTIGRVLGKARKISDDFKEEIEKNIRSEEKDEKPDIQDSAPQKNLELPENVDSSSVYRIVSIIMSRVGDI